MSWSLASCSAIYTKCEHSVNVFHVVSVMVAFGAGKIRALENISLYNAYGSLRLSTSRSKIEINPRKLLSTRTVLASWEHCDVLSSPKTSLTITDQHYPNFTSKARKSSFSENKGKKSSSARQSFRAHSPEANTTTLQPCILHGGNRMKSSLRP